MEINSLNWKIGVTWCTHIFINAIVMVFCNAMQFVHNIIIIYTLYRSSVFFCSKWKCKLLIVIIEKEDIYVEANKTRHISNIWHQGTIETVTFSIFLRNANRTHHRHFLNNITIHAYYAKKSYLDILFFISLKTL